MTASPGLFLTGTSGFIGRRLLERLMAAGGRDIRCLTRRAPPSKQGGVVHFVQGDLLAPQTYANWIRPGDVVVHLAAQTGKASREQFVRINVEGTRALLDACRVAGAQRFVYVSSIAATYSPETSGAYGASKRQAEDIVRESGLSHVIVRPTIVFGRGSATWNGLAALAGLPVMTIFGAGRVRVQPIEVDDVAAALASIIDDASLAGRALDLGGPDVLTLEELVRRMRRFMGRGDGPTLRVPVAPIRLFLRAVEPWLQPLLPFTSSQFSVFVNDSAARADAWVTAMQPSMVGLDEMIRRSANHG